jgi:hypothetical protein
MPDDEPIWSKHVATLIVIKLVVFKGTFFLSVPVLFLENFITKQDIMYTELIKSGVSEAFAIGALHLRVKYQRKKLQYVNNDKYSIFMYCMLCNIHSSFI